MTHLKKSLAMLLALIMMFSSMSVAATAWTIDDEPNDITFTVKFFRESPKNSGNWIETEKAAPGENVRLRVYIKTGFYTTGGETCIVFDKDYFNIRNVVNDLSTPLRVNESYSGPEDDAYEAGEYALRANASWKNDATFYEWYDKYDMDYILNEIEKDPDFFKTHEFVGGNIQYYNGKVNCKMVDDQWLFEYELAVKDNEVTNTIGSEGESRVPHFYNSADREGDFPIDIVKGKEGVDLNDTANNRNMFMWYPEFYSNPDTISTTSTIIYDMGLVDNNGEWKEKTHKVVDGIIGKEANLNEIANPVHPDGLTFSHWSTQKPGEGVTQDKVSTIAYDYDALTLYAVWSAPSDVNYTLKEFYMNADGKYPADSEVEGVTKSAAPDSTVSAPASTDPLYVLDETKSDKNVVIDANGSSVVNAYYERVKYNLVYHYEDMNGEQTDVYPTIFGAPLHTFDAFDSHIPEKTGYTFLGWTTDINGTEPEVLPSVMPTEDLHLYPVYEPGETFDVEHIFDAGEGGTFSDGEQLRRYAYKFGDATITPENPTAPGKEFTGWDDKIPAEAYEDRRFEAMYEDIIYTVTFKADTDDDGTYETVSEKEFIYGEKLYPEFAPESYPLDVWMLEDGTAVTIANDETAYTVTESVVLVTKAKDEYPARFYWSKEDMDNGAEPYTTVYVKFGKEIPAPADPEKAGYTFEQWELDLDGQYMDSIDGKDFYAIFEANDITVTYDANKGECDVESETLKYENSVILPEATREGYEFLGWFDGKEKAGDAGDSYAVPTEDVTLKAEWDAEEHIITFLDGENKIGEIKADTDAEIKTPEDLNPPVKNGYTFTGWVTEDGKPAEVPATMPAEDMVLTATWEKNSFALNADANGGKFANGEGTLSAEIPYGAELKVEEPKKDGHTFLGWANADDENNTIITLPATMPDEAINIKAVWGTNKHSVVYDAAGGTFADDRSAKTYYDIEYGAPVPVPENNPIREGYNFIRWSPEIPDAMPDENLNFRAEWELIPEPDDQVYEIYVSYPNPANPDETLEKYVTKGSAKPGKTVEIIKAGEESTADKVHTYEEIIAIAGVEGIEPDYNNRPAKITVVEGENKIVVSFKLKKFTVEFNPKGGNFNGSEESVVVSGEFGSKVEAPADPVRKGYTFVGWDKDVPATFTENLTLNANWDIQKHNAIFVVKNEKGEEVDRIPVEYSYGETIVAPGYTAPAGYEFNGWSIPEGTTMGETDIVFNTKLVPIYYSLSYTISGLPADKGVVAPATKTGLRYGEQTPVAAAPEVDGYTFSGWTYGEKAYPSDGTGIMVIDGNATLKGTYTAETFKISFDSNGAGNVADKNYKCDETVNELPVVSKKDHKFLGWYEGETKVEAPFKMPARDMKLEAKWEKIVVTKYSVITLDANGGQFSNGATVYPVKAEVGVPFNAVPANPTREGYVFKGWVDENGNETSIPKVFPEEDVTIKAKWAELYDVTYYDTDNTKEFAKFPNAGEQGAKLPVLEDVPVKEGSTFAGWVDADGNAVTVIPAGDIKLYPSWTTNSHTVTYDANGGVFAEGVENVFIVEYGAEIPVPAQPTKEGYNFVRWTPEAPDAMPDTDLVFTAEWKEIPKPEAQTYEIYVSYPNPANPEQIIEKLIITDSAVEGSTVEILKSGETQTADKAHTYDEIIAKVDANGVEPDYENRPGVTTIGDNNKIVVNFKLTEYTAEFDGNGGVIYDDNGDENEKVILKGYYGQPIDIPGDDELYREGYSFTGWDKDVPATFTENTVIKATWEKDIYDAYFYIVDENGDEILFKTVSFEFGDEIVAPEYTPDEGYVFSGWDVEGQTMPAHDVDFTATLTPNGYKLSYVLAGLPADKGVAAPAEQTGLKAGKDADVAEAPVVPGYEFDGFWYDENGVEYIADGTDKINMPAADVVLTATYSAKSYSIRYNSDGAGAVPTETYKCDQQVEALPEVTKEGYTFLGWYEGETKVEAPFTMPARDMLLKAMWATDVVTKTLTIDANGGTFADGETVKTQVVVVGDDIKDLPVPSREGFDFAGWEGIPEDGKMPESDLTIKAIWTPVAIPEYNIEYYYAVGGALYDTLTFEEGETIVHPADPTVEGFTFIGWADENGNELPTVMGSEDIKAYAQFEVNKYKVTYIVDDSVYMEYEVAYQAEVPVPADPADSATRLFAGWQPNVEDVMPAHDLTYTATWIAAPEPEEYTATFLRHNGETHAKYVLEEGDVISVPAAPERFGYVFVGWEPEVPDTMPGHDMVFEPKYEVDKTFVTIVIGGGVVIAGGAIVGSIIGSNIAIITGASIVGGILVIVGVSELVKHTHTVTYLVDGEVYKTYKVVEGTRIPVPADPAKDGFTFEGWNPEVPERMGNEDLVFEATWSENAVDDSADGEDSTDAEDYPEVEVPVPDTGSVAGGLTAFAVISGAAAAAYVITRRKKED